MKNIKRFQNTVCQGEKLDNHVDKLIQTVKQNNDSVSVLFSGILSSFISTLISMALDEAIEYPLIRIGIIVGVFFGVWLLTAKWIVPAIRNFADQRKTTLIDDLSKHEVVNTFNAAITLSAIEINDAISIMEDQEQDESCRKINQVIIASEYVKCINYIVENVKKTHVRTYDERSDKLPYNYINLYSLILVYKMLYDSGIHLQTIFQSLTSNGNDVLLIRYDLDSAIVAFSKHRENFGIDLLKFEEP